MVQAQVMDCSAQVHMTRWFDQMYKVSSLKISKYLSKYTDNTTPILVTYHSLPDQKSGMTSALQQKHQDQTSARSMEPNPWFFQNERY
jgi:hypothetical protein